MTGPLSGVEAVGHDRAVGGAAAWIDHVLIPSARLGPDSTLPEMFGPGDVHQVDGGSEVDEEMRAGLSYGRVASIAPYPAQRQYSRVLREASHRVVVLENDHLRAEILPDLGARVRSLFDKRARRELLYCNAVFQPANLALRNAWFSGGIEWNIGTIGHSPFTASPLHGRIVHRSDGAASYLAYEYERLRGVVFSIEFVLAPDSDALLVTITIENPTRSTVPMYWWSNIAVPETAESRVIVPARTAWSFGYEGIVSRRAIPDDGVGTTDRTYPARADHAIDYFFDLEPRGEQPWIAAADGDGYGLVQSSDRTLRGRKLFVWGNGVGGRRWQSWLSHGTGRYFEIQAGIARTQLEHVPMPAGARWTWTESYGAVALEPAAVHGDWDAAVEAVGSSTELGVHRGGIEAEHSRDRSADSWGMTVGQGSGWGALERHRREAAGEDPLPEGEDRFPDGSLDSAQRYWMAALGLQAWPDAGAGTSSSERNEWWTQVIAVQDDSTSHLHRAIIESAAGRYDRARSHAQEAVVRGGGWLAHRTLGALLSHSGDHIAAADQYEVALRQNAGHRELIAEAAPVLIRGGRSSSVIRAIDALPAPDRAGRLGLLRARASLATGDTTAASIYFESGEIPADLAEGDEELLELWSDLQVATLGLDVAELGLEGARRAAGLRRPIPDGWNFRMRPDDPQSKRSTSE